ncbi:hypothetical protein [Thermotoga profunda]|nr:hypothetical protein [Thermotoga profunda]
MKILRKALQIKDISDIYEWECAQFTGFCCLSGVCCKSVLNG